jgi:hypothetical protein
MLYAEGFPRHPSLDRPTLGQPKPIQIDLDQAASAVPKYPAMRAGADTCWKIANRKRRSDVEAFWLLVFFFWTAIDPAIGQTPKLQIDPKIWQGTCHAAPTGSSFLGGGNRVVQLIPACLTDKIPLSLNAMEPPMLNGIVTKQ